ELNNYRAEYGRNGGPVVNIVTKSGSKQYKGSAYWYKRDENLNANDFFNNRNGVAKPIYRFDTVGATLGGPIPVPGMKSSRDKLFFFYSFDGLKSLNPRPLQQVTTPSALERAGDFSQSLDVNGRLIAVRDPLTGLPFAGNVIPQARINRSGRRCSGCFRSPTRWIAASRKAPTTTTSRKASTCRSARTWCASTITRRRGTRSTGVSRRGTAT